ncbi:MAG: hypothetical protein O2973_08185 [Gemmatimonadetes bacterium]|nr:hypothetical protein [Gemmatimonadota bacterium]
MMKSQRYRGEAIRREQQFLDAHPDIFGQVNASEARKKLDAALTKLDSVVNVQLVRARDARGEIQRQKALERDLRDRHVTPVTMFAQGQLAGVPEFAALTPSANNLRGARLVDAALAMAVAAQPYAQLYSAAAFPAKFVQQLTDAANAVQASIDTRRRKIADRVGATAGVEATLKEARAAALMVGAAVSRIVVRGTPLFHEWTVVRRVVAAATRPKKETEVAGSIEPAVEATQATQVKLDVAA